MPLFDQFSDRLSFRFFTRDDPADTFFEAAQKWGQRNLAYPEQVHGNITVIADKNGEVKGADGLITDMTDLTLGIRAADCQLFLVFVPEKNILGVLHAGWRGLAKHAIDSFFFTLLKNWDITPKDIFIWSGPSLCKNCARFSDPYHELPAHLHPFIDDHQVDLIAAAEHAFDHFGIPMSQRERSPDCTMCSSDTYFSYRKMKQEENGSSPDASQRNFLLARLSVQ